MEGNIVKFLPASYGPIEFSIAFQCHGLVAEIVPLMRNLDPDLWSDILLGRQITKKFLKAFFEEGGILPKWAIFRMYQKYSPDFFVKYHDHFEGGCLTFVHRWTPEIVSKLITQIPWKEASTYHVIPTMVLTAYPQYVYWKKYSRYNIRVKDLHKCPGRIRWETMYDHNVCEERVLCEHYAHVIWNPKRFHSLSDYFLKKIESEFGNRFDYRENDVLDIFARNYFSEGQIEMLLSSKKRRLSWERVSRICILSESFIRRHADQVIWYNITSYQDHISDKFIDEFARKVDWYILSKKRQLPLWLIRKHRKRVDWRRICKYQNLPPAFVSEHKEYVNWNELAVRGIFP